MRQQCCVAGGLSHAHGRDHDAVRRAVKAGEIRSLTDILNAIRDKLPGEIVGVEIERKNGRWVYEFRVVDGKGRLFEVHVDARSGEIERSQGEVMRVLLVEDDRRIASDVSRALEPQATWSRP